MPEVYRFRVEGRVQGVGFRQATRAKAMALGLRGWVRNLPDGRVEGLASGHPVALCALRDWLALGPPAASVAALDWIAEASAEDGREGFAILR